MSLATKSALRSQQWAFSFLDSFANSLASSSQLGLEPTSRPLSGSRSGGGCKIWKIEQEDAENTHSKKHAYFMML